MSPALFATELLPNGVSYSQIGALIAAIVLFAWLLRSMRTMRKDVADEIRRELEGGKRAAPVQVQQPLIVRQDSEPATKTELADLERRLGQEIHQLHGRVSGMRNEVSAQLKEMEHRSDAKFERMGERLDEVPARTIALLTSTKSLHASSGE